LRKKSIHFFRVPELSSEETIGEEYSQSFASSEPTTSRSEPNKHEVTVEDTDTNKLVIETLARATLALVLL